jgi:co-chaperonin GroES (HSP10)
MMESELIGFNPVEFKVLIKLDKVEETTCSGLIIRPDTVRDREQIAQERGTIAAVGGRAFEDFGEPKPKVGDRVAFSKYVGATMNDAGDRSQLWRIVNDKDIHGIFAKE